MTGVNELTGSKKILRQCTINFNVKLCCPMMIKLRIVNFQEPGLHVLRQHVDTGLGNGQSTCIWSTLLQVS